MAVSVVEVMCRSLLTCACTLHSRHVTQDIASLMPSYCLQVAQAARLMQRGDSHMNMRLSLARREAR